MTTTENTITISFNDADNESVTAAYYQIEDGWVTFKSEDHKAVAAYPAPRVTSIKGDRVLHSMTRAEVIDEVAEVVSSAIDSYDQERAKYGEADVPFARSIAGVLVARGYHPFALQAKATAAAEN